MGVMKRVVIAGGGIAGLAAAWYLQRAAQESGLALRYTLLEGSGRWGGKVQSQRVEGFGEPPFLLEEGPDAFLTRKPWAVALAREVGLGERMVGVNLANARTFVLHRGRPESIPEGVQLVAPTRLWPFVRSPLFTPWGKLRVGLDLVLPPRRGEADESLASFVRRRFGPEALDKLAEPLLAGVYNGVPEEQSIEATFPQYRAMERRYGSVIRGLRAAGRERGRPSGTAEANGGEAMPAFVSFDSGTHALVEAVVARLTGELRLGCAAERIERAAEGNGYVVALRDGEREAADAVIVATPARVAAGMLREVAPEAAERLATIRVASIGTAYLAYRREQVAHALDGFGLVIPSSEGRRIDGITWTSSKWTSRAPEGDVLLRVFFGGPHTRSMMDLDDAELLAAVRAEAGAMLGVRGGPLFERVFRWPDGYPQYDVGHLERVAAIEAALPAGVHVTGSSYRGVGVPDCVRQGQEAARQVVAALGAVRG